MAGRQSCLAVWLQTRNLDYETGWTGYPGQRLITLNSRTKRTAFLSAEKEIKNKKKNIQDFFKEFC